MLQYSDETIKSILNEILNQPIKEINPIGNHELKRHLVYRVLTSNDDGLIVKFYYKPNRQKNEVASLKVLSKYNVKTPNLIQYGTLKDGVDYMIIEYVEGVILESIIDKLNHQEIETLFYEMGHTLGKIHLIKDSTSSHTNYFTKWKNQFNQVIEQVKTADIPEQNILDQAIKKIKEEEHLLDIKVTNGLVHNDFDGRNLIIDQVNNHYHINAVIDFEISSIGNTELDLVNLYYKYFLKDKNLELAFLRGYKKYIQLDPNFYKRLEVYLLSNSVENCSWAYHQAPDYYKENIIFLENILST